MSLVDRKIIRHPVVAANSTWIMHDDSGSAVLALVLNEILDIILGELAVKTLLHVFDFLCLNWVVVVRCGLVDKSLVERTLEEKVEVGHESRIVTIFVLSKDGVKSIENFLGGLIFLLLLGKTKAELDEGDSGQAINEAKDSLLN